MCSSDLVEEDLVVEQPGPPHPTTRAMRGVICGGAGGQFPVSEPSLKEMDDWEEKGGTRRTPGGEPQGLQTPPGRGPAWTAPRPHLGASSTDSRSLFAYKFTPGLKTQGVSTIF